MDMGFLKSNGRANGSARVRLETAYQRIADLTAKKCGAPCGRPGFCCSEEHCRATMTLARDVYGIHLPQTGHKSLPLMGNGGCVAPPYLRPHCAVYVCQKQLDEDSNFATHYRFLREDVEKVEREMEKDPSKRKYIAIQQPSRKRTRDQLDDFE